MKSAYICIHMVEPQVIDPNRATAQNWLLTFHIHLVFFIGRNKSPYKILSESVEKQQSYNYFFAAADSRQICPKVWNTEIRPNSVLYPWWSRFPPWMFFFAIMWFLQPMPCQIGLKSPPFSWNISSYAISYTWRLIEDNLICPKVWNTEIPSTWIFMNS